MQYRPIRFPTGEVRATTAALANVSKEKLICLVNRHIRGNWGDTCMADQKANEQAIRDGDRILSWYCHSGTAQRGTYDLPHERCQHSGLTAYSMENTSATEERDETSVCYSKGNVDYYIISNYDQSKVAWQLGLNTYVIGGQISENEAKEIIDSIT